MDLNAAVGILRDANLGGVLREAADMAADALQGTSGQLALVMVVTVPDGAAQDLEALQQRIVQEMGQRVLVLPDGYRWSVEHLPVAVEVEAERPPPPPGPDEAREKREILAQLKVYRQSAGLGCLETLARAVRRKDVTEDILRSALTGDAILSLAQWRAVRRGMEKLEAKT